MDPKELELEFLRIDLGFMEPDAATQKYMEHLLDTSRLELGEKGIDLVEAKSDDLSLVVMYAAWLYRRRDGSGAMPEMLRYSINNHKSRMTRRTKR